MPIGMKVNVTNETYRVVGTEIVKRNRACLTKEIFESQVRVIIVVLTVVMGKMIRFLDVNLFLKFREIRQINTGIYQTDHAFSGLHCFH